MWTFNTSSSVSLCSQDLLNSVTKLFQFHIHSNHKKNNSRNDSSRCVLSVLCSKSLCNEPIRERNSPVKEIERLDSSNCAHPVCSGLRGRGASGNVSSAHFSDRYISRVASFLRALLLEVPQTEAQHFPIQQNGQHGDYSENRLFLFLSVHPFYRSKLLSFSEKLPLVNITYLIPSLLFVLFWLRAVSSNA